MTLKNTVLIEKRVKHFLLHQHVHKFCYGNTLTNKYCKTGGPEKLICQGLYLDK